MWFNIEKHNDWWWWAFDISFIEAWGVAEGFSKGEDILALNLSVRRGWWPVHIEPKAGDFARWGVKVSSIIRVAEHSRMWLMTKSEVSGLSRLRYEPGVHLIDCEGTPAEESIRGLLADHFADDYFEEELTHELAKELESSVTMFSISGAETRVECLDRELGDELLRTVLRNLICTLELQSSIEITSEHIDLIVEKTLLNRGPIKMKAKDVQLTDSGFKMTFKGHRARFVLEADGLQSVIKEL